MNKKNTNIKHGDLNVDENSLQHFIKHIVCIYETEKQQRKFKDMSQLAFKCTHNPYT